MYSKEHLLKIWKNNSIELYCCNCYQYFMYKNDIQLTESFIFPTDLKKCSICKTSLDIIQFGIINSIKTRDELLSSWNDPDFVINCGNCKAILKRRRYIARLMKKILKEKKEDRITIKNLEPKERYFLKDLREENNLRISLKSKETPLIRGFIVENGHIIRLGLANCGLKSVPESIGNLTSLKKLNLDNNYLIKIPESIGFLKVLEILRVRKNYLRGLPNSIMNLYKLKGLDISNNKLTHMPYPMGSLISLRYLDISGNKIEYLPDFLHSLPLKYLYITGNKIEDIPKFFKQQAEEGKLLINY